MDSKDKILSFEILVTKFPFRLSLLEYFGLTKAMPKCRLRSIKPNNIQEQSKLKSDHITITINKRIKPLSIIQSQDLYRALMSGKVKPPSFNLTFGITYSPFLNVLTGMKFLKQYFR